MISVDLTRRLRSGTQLGHYVIREWIAAGGTADLYTCDIRTSGQATPSRFVAKVFRFDGDEEVYDRRVRLFRKEIETLSALGGNIHIISVLESGEYIEQGDDIRSRPFCILPKLDGGTLSSRIATRPLVAEEACTIALGLTDALSYAHSRGVLHCDVKPDNVMLDSSDNPVWIDFGIAKEMDTGEDAVSVISEIGTVATGTAPYMSPEHFEGRHALSPQADVWSMGVLLLRMLTSEFPFGKNFTQVRQRVSGKTWTSIEELPVFAETNIPVGIPLPLQKIILNCLQVRLDDRYQSARELEDDLRAFLRSQPLLRARVNLKPASVQAGSRGSSQIGNTRPATSHDQGNATWRGWIAPGVVGGIFVLIIAFFVFRNVIDFGGVQTSQTNTIDSTNSNRGLIPEENIPLTPVESGRNGTNEGVEPIPEVVTASADSLELRAPIQQTVAVSVTLVPNTGYNPEKVTINGQNVHPNQGLLKRFEAFAGQRFTWEIETTDGVTVRKEIVLPEGRSEIKVDWLSASILDT